MYVNLLFLFKLHIELLLKLWRVFFPSFLHYLNMFKQSIPNALKYSVFFISGADANLSDINGNTALHLASSIPSNELCNLLLDYHADVHAKNKVCIIRLVAEIGK